MDGLSDRGSTPLRSIKIVSQDEILWDYFLYPSGRRISWERDFSDRGAERPGDVR